MKRSEAIVIIKNILNKHNVPDCVSEEILSQLEAKGFLPPVSKLTHLDFYDNSYEGE
jgi:hypothetical protein